VERPVDVNRSDTAHIGFSPTFKPIARACRIAANIVCGFVMLR
jgi:hypothetical protein